MNLRLIAAAAVALGAGTASAQYPALVPHRGHYHVVPSYSPPVYGGFGFGYSSPGFSTYTPGFYGSPGLGYGRSYSPGFGYGGYGSGWGSHHHGHHHHGHR